MAERRVRKSWDRKRPPPSYGLALTFKALIKSCLSSSFSWPSDIEVTDLSPFTMSRVLEKYNSLSEFLRKKVMIRSGSRSWSGRRSSYLILFSMSSTSLPMLTRCGEDSFTGDSDSFCRVRDPPRFRVPTSPDFFCNQSMTVEVSL